MYSTRQCVGHDARWIYPAHRPPLFLQARAAVLDAVVADLADLLPGGGGGEQRVVDMAQNFFHIHRIWCPFQEK